MMEFRNGADIVALRSLWKEAFGDTDEFLDSFFATAYSPERCLAAFIDNDLAGALYIIDCELNSQKIAYIYAVCTAKKHRGKGVCKKLMAHTHLYLKNRGFTAAILVPGSKELFAFYEKLGYKTCGYLDEFECKAHCGDLDFLEISAEEYEILRRSFLPENSVTGENSQFLKTQLRFFKGDGFIFAARLEKNRLFIAELLGDKATAPQIVAAFGKASGVFRTLGNSKPFAMGFSLTRQPLPDNLHFAFAFD